MEQDVLITGGGLNGCALALALAQAGQRVALVDALPVAAQQADGFDGRSYALAHGSVRMLKALGLWEALAPTAQPMTAIKVSDGRVGDAQVFLGLHFDSAELEEGPMGFMVEDRHLRRVLLDAVATAPGVTHLPGCRVDTQESDAKGVSVTLEDGRSLTARLLVGADGRASGTALRAGIARQGHGYGQTAMVCALQHALPHGGIAHQLFLPEGPLAVLPLQDDRVSIVWSAPEARAAALSRLTDADYLRVLRTRMGAFLGDFALTGTRYTYPLELSLARSLTAPRLALVGDAAHRLHPIAGQGLNAGLRDVACLADVLTHAAKRGEDIGAADVLARYARWRSFDTSALALATDAFNRLFSNDNPLLRLGRDIGMALVNATGPLRRGAMREAAGLTGDLPELMQ